MIELYAIDRATLVEIGNAIREKSGTNGPIPVTELAGRISELGGATEKKEYLISAGTYVDKNDVTGNYESLPYPSYHAEADIAGELSRSDGSIVSFTKMSISGYGLGMDNDNTLVDAPYPRIAFYNGDFLLCEFEGYEFNSYDFSIHVHASAEVSAVFCIAFKGVFAKQ